MIFTVASKYSFPVFFNGKPSYIKFWKPLFCFKIYFPPSPPSPFMHSIALPFFFSPGCLARISPKHCLYLK